MNYGSLRGSIFALSSSAIGAGVLSLPYVLALNGFAAGFIFLAIGAVGFEISLKILGSVAVKHNLLNYSKVAHLAGGNKL